MGRDLSGIQVQALTEIASGASRVLEEEVDDARLAVGPAAARSGAPTARASSGRTAHRAGRRGSSRAVAVGGDRPLLLIDVIERLEVKLRSFGLDVTSGHVRSFPSLCWVRAEGRGLAPSVQTRCGRDLRPGGEGPLSVAPTPTRSRTRNPNPPPRGAGYCAVGGMQA